MKNYLTIVISFLIVGARGGAVNAQQNLERLARDVTIYRDTYRTSACMTIFVEEPGQHINRRTVWLAVAERYKDYFVTAAW